MLILMNPGPVGLSEGVRQALLKPDLCHREAEFTILQTGISQKLLEVYALPASDWAAILLTGSGSAAMEAMLCSLVTNKVLIIENGVYGERLTQMAVAHGINHHCVSYDWGQKIDMAQLASTLDQHPDLSQVAMIHHETTTGLLNPVNAVAKLCKQKNLGLLVDGVSSFGAEAIDFEQLDACASTANKCLHGVPGVSFVLARRRLFSTPPQVARSVYFDLHHYLSCQTQNTVPFTPAIPAYYALDTALDELKTAGGWQSRHQDYSHKMALLRSALPRLGMQEYLSQGEHSVVLNAFYLPNQLSYAQLHDQLKQEGFVIYAGQGELLNIFRLSVMGNMTVANIECFISVLEKLLNGQ